MKTIILFSIISFFTFASHAQIVSDFNSNDDGWTATHVGGTVATTAYQNTDGNPGGYMSIAPPTSGGSVNTSMAWYWNAPAKFFGKHSWSYGSTIEFDLQQSVAGTDNTQSDIIIESMSNATIHLRFVNKPAVGPAWTTYAIKLDETAEWHYGSIGGVIARKYFIKEILANIKSIKIRGKYINSAGYTSGIDNVILKERTLENSPIITSFSPIAALPGESVTINGTNFGATIDDNIVRFGNVRATITSVTPSKIVASVPSGATYAPIFVINTTGGLVAQSASEFRPLLHEDPDLTGHIIPATFAQNVIIPYGDFNDNGLAGGNLGDLDGDGLLDIVAFEDGQRKFAIFLNQGQTGTISNTSFSSKIEIPSGELGQGNSAGTLLADFDNDGKIDITTFSRGRDDDPIFDGGFAVSRNLSTPGNIQFATAERFYRLTIFCSDMKAEDLDGDGRLDFIVTSGGLRVAQNISTPGKIDFAATNTISAASGAVTTQDLNGDGKPEVIVVGSNLYEIHENISTPGNILFAAPFTLPGSIVSGVSFSDLDNDTKPDIIFYRINGFNNYDLVIKKNIHTTGSLSASSFDADVIISKTGRAYSQRIADLNGDAKPEILIAANSGSGGNGFLVFENAAQDGALNTSSFLEGVLYEETATGVFAIPLIGDIDSDNKPDIIGFGSSDGSEHSLILYHNESIAPPQIAIHTVSPNAAAIGSTVTITGNKFATTASQNKVWFGAVQANVLTATKTMLTVSVPAGASYERVSVTRNNLTSRYHLPFITTFSAGTTFDNTSFLPPITYSLTGADYDVEVADLNGDGKPEIIAESRVVTGIIRNYAFTYRNDHSSGPITASSFTVTDSTNDSAYNLKIVDIDEDGRPDITSLNSIFRNSTASGDINFDDDVAKTNGDNQSWADFDLDGKTDLIANNTGGGVLQIYRNHSMPRPFRSGNFSTLAPVINLAKPALGGGTATGDFDNDGNVEFVSSNPTTDNVRIWKNTGGFPVSAAQFTLVGDISAGDVPGRVYPGDLDVDGKLDFILYHGTGTNSAIISVFHNQSTVSNISFNKVDFTLPNAATVAHVSDLDGDGKPEILATSEGSGKFFILKNTSTPGTIDASSFATPFQTLVAGARGITTGDLNLDGKPEIIITATPDKLLIFENNIAVGPSITVDAQPTSTYACEGANATFTVDASGTTNITYHWQFDNGSGFTDLNEGNGYSGTSTKAITINTTLTGFSSAGSYRCKVTGDLATDAFTNDVQLTINSIPSAPDVTGDTECTSPATLTLTATGSSDGFYQWFDEPIGGSILGTNGSFTTSIAATKTYYVLIHDTFCESERVPVDATVTLLAKPLINTSEPITNGSINLCDGDNCTLTAPTGFISYTWSNGATADEITISQNGIYSVVVEDGAGCVSPASDPITVTINPYPLAEITANGTQLSASPGDGYQWLENDEAISGENSQTFIFNLLEYGEYAVDVTDNGCTTRSDTYIYLITGKESMIDRLKIYPNPFIDNVTIETSSSTRHVVQVIDMLGREVKAFSVFDIATINLNDLQIGNYTVIVREGDWQKRFRLVKTK